MAKKRNCRRTEEELNIHKEALRLRKMTDSQLVEAFRNAGEAAGRTDVAQDVSEENNPTENTNGVQKLLNELAEGKCKGIKGATVYKISEFATELGLL